MPIQLPIASMSKYWFTAMRYILPSQERDLHAFRLLDVHFLFSKMDICKIVCGLKKWEQSDKRCCLWVYTNSTISSRPYCAAAFGLNIAADKYCESLTINFDFLTHQLIHLSQPRIINDKLWGIKYGDDEWLLFLLVDHYFTDPNTNTIDDSAVHYINASDRSGMFMGKTAINQASTTYRYNKVRTLVDSNMFPYTISDKSTIECLYKLRHI